MQEIQIIQQLIDQATKSGLFANMASALTVAQAWESIKQKLIANDGNNNKHSSQPN